MKDDLKFDKYKNIHINILNDTHAQLRIMCFKYKLSMQEVFEEISQRIVQEDPVLMEILNEVYENKKQRKIQKLSQTDASSLYEIINQSSPFSE